MENKTYICPNCGGEEVVGGLESCMLTDGVDYIDTVDYSQFVDDEELAHWGC